MMNDVDDLLDSAFDDYNRGDLASAEQKARSALIISPSHGDCFYLLGLIAHRKGIYAQACDLLSVAVKAYPEQSNYQLALAEVYQYHGHYNEALKIYEKFSNNPQVQIQLGWIAIHQKKLEKAKDIFKKLLSTPLIAKAYYGLAFCYSDRTRLKYLNKSLKLEKNSVVVDEIVKYYLGKNQLKKISSYIPLIKNELIKAQCLFSLKKYKEAMTILNEYIQKNPYDISALILAGACSEKSKDYLSAEKFYHQALSLNQDNPDAHKAMARLMMSQGKLSIALNHYQVLCRLDPTDKETLLAMATTLEGVGDEAEALGIYFRLITLNCKGLNTRIKSCIQKLYLKDKKLAKQFAQGWSKNAPQNKTAQNLLKILGVFLLIIGIISPCNADYFSDDQNWDLAWKNKMAEFGYPESQYELAEMFETGKGVPQNLSQAVKYYQFAAVQNYFPAMLKLGEIFGQENAYHDLEKSLQWYTYAAQKGEVQAQLYLSEYYQNDSPDKEKAKFWLGKALKQLFPEAKDLTQVSPDYKKLLES